MLRITKQHSFGSFLAVFAGLTLANSASAAQTDTVELEGPLIGDNICHFSDDNPIEGSGTWDPTFAPVSLVSVSLSVDAFDVDAADGEQDDVYLNGVLLGSLTGSDNTESTTTFNLTAAQMLAIFGPPPYDRDLLADIYIDVLNGAWCAEVDAIRVNITYTAAPVDKQQCKNGGWRTLVHANGSPFRNQGDCVSYVATGGGGVP